MIVGKIRVETYRGMSFGIYDENNRLHATGVDGRVDLQALCDGYNAMLDLKNMSADDTPIFEDDWSSGQVAEIKNTTPAEEPRRGRGRPRKEVTE